MEKTNNKITALVPLTDNRYKLVVYEEKKNQTWKWIISTFFTEIWWRYPYALFMLFMQWFKVYVSKEIIQAQEDVFNLNMLLQDWFWRILKFFIILFRLICKESVFLINFFNDTYFFITKKLLSKRNWQKFDFLEEAVINEFIFLIIELFNNIINVLKNNIWFFLTTLWDWRLHIVFFPDKIDKLMDDRVLDTQLARDFFLAWCFQIWISSNLTIWFIFDNFMEYYYLWFNDFVYLKTKTYNYIVRIFYKRYIHFIAYIENLRYYAYINLLHFYPIFFYVAYVCYFCSISIKWFVFMFVFYYLYYVKNFFYYCWVISYWLLYRFPKFCWKYFRFFFKYWRDYKFRFWDLPIFHPDFRNPLRLRQDLYADFFYSWFILNFTYVLNGLWTDIGELVYDLFSVIQKLNIILVKKINYIFCFIIKCIKYNLKYFYVKTANLNKNLFYEEYLLNLRIFLFNVCLFIIMYIFIIIIIIKKNYEYYVLTSICCKYFCENYLITIILRIKLFYYYIQKFCRLNINLIVNNIFTRQINKTIKFINFFIYYLLIILQNFKIFFSKDSFLRYLNYYKELFFHSCIRGVIYFLVWYNYLITDFVEIIYNYKELFFHSCIRGVIYFLVWYNYLITDFVEIIYGQNGWLMWLILYFKNKYARFVLNIPIRLVTFLYLFKKLILSFWFLIYLVIIILYWCFFFFGNFYKNRAVEFNIWWFLIKWTLFINEVCSDIKNLKFFQLIKLNFIILFEKIKFSFFEIFSFLLEKYYTFVVYKIIWQNNKLWIKLYKDIYEWIQYIMFYFSKKKKIINCYYNLKKFKLYTYYLYLFILNNYLWNFLRFLIFYIFLCKQHIILIFFFIKCTLKNNYFITNLKKKNIFILIFLWKSVLFFINYIILFNNFKFKAIRIELLKFNSVILNKNSKSALLFSKNYFKFYVKYLHKYFIFYGTKILYKLDIFFFTHIAYTRIMYLTFFFFIKNKFYSYIYMDFILYKLSLIKSSFFKSSKSIYFKIRAIRKKLVSTLKLLYTAFIACCLFLKQSSIDNWHRKRLKLEKKFQIKEFTSQKRESWYNIVKKFSKFRPIFDIIIGCLVIILIIIIFFIGCLILYFFLIILLARVLYILSPIVYFFFFLKSWIGYFIVYSLLFLIKLFILFFLKIFDNFIKFLNFILFLQFRIKRRKAFINYWRNLYILKHTFFKPYFIPFWIYLKYYKKKFFFKICLIICKKIIRFFWK